MNEKEKEISLSLMQWVAAIRSKGATASDIFSALSGFAVAHAIAIGWKRERFVAFMGAAFDDAIKSEKT